MDILNTLCTSLEPVYARVQDKDGLAYSLLKVTVSGRRTVIEGYDLLDCINCLMGLPELKGSIR